MRPDNDLAKPAMPAPREGDEPVRCDTCLAEVPTSVAKSVEGVDYVLYFCGLDCMARWLKQDKTAAACSP